MCSNFALSSMFEAVTAPTVGSFHGFRENDDFDMVCSSQIHVCGAKQNLLIVCTIAISLYVQHEYVYDIYATFALFGLPLTPHWPSFGAHVLPVASASFGSLWGAI